MGRILFVLFVFAACVRADNQRVQFIHRARSWYCKLGLRLMSICEEPADRNKSAPFRHHETHDAKKFYCENATVDSLDDERCARIRNRSAPQSPPSIPADISSPKFPPSSPFTGTSSPSYESQNTSVNPPPTQQPLQQPLQQQPLQQQ